MEIALLKPVQMLGRHHIDVRDLHHSETTLEQQEQGRSAAHYTVFALASMPPELLPDHHTRNPKSREGRGSTFDLSESELRGDIEPVSLATFDGPHCRGMFCLLGIRVLSSNGRSVAVRCRVFQGDTGLVDSGEHRGWARRFADVAESIAGRSFDLADGGVLRVDEVETALYNQGDDTPADTRIRLFREEMATRGHGRQPYRTRDRVGWELLTVVGGA